jgi:hypothetical protein
MAKSAAPFMSINPSGSIAGLLTASRWKGRPYLRLLVIPSNPRTADQQNIRYSLGIIAKACANVLTSTKDTYSFGSQFFQATRDQAPSGQSWISFVQKSTAALELAGVKTTYDGLSGTIKGYFDSAAATAGFVSYSPTWFTGTPDDLATAGGQLFTLAYFSSNFESGAIKTLADLAIAGASLTPVTNFADSIIESYD